MKNLIVIAAGLAVLAGLFVLMNPEPPAAPVADAGSKQSLSVAAIQPPAEKIFELEISNKKLVRGQAVIQVQQGETVTLRILSDHHDELHLHGYDLTLPLPTGQAAELRFVADRSGRFEYELHHAHLDLGALEVLPR